MTTKSPILPERLRKVPKQFSWLDHRLVRDRHIEACSHPAAALFLVTVGDRMGLIYYGDASIMKRLSMDQSTLESARCNLIRIGLIAWKRPLYQVLSLDVHHPDVPRQTTAQPLSLGEILKKAAGGAA
ncbi:hypothetical protein [Desulfococcus multivorans]|uniref:Uncharacterized protein n=1 Tax=Desulfococcus multivorans DSM 2059 TaxID=1121405 RepID=S7UJL2_DESML|nr:hypothetical protein [Desulfococcus multivorans]AOY60488.1 conserved uncharacterized protein [Desulfococcus multivorans]AQV02584.1 hypothetical protein B2D07_18595 [Desulfococcus multivorans]EPR32508.1 hypothetical protein dsmv_0881 [Desulfococcus multivorans DSM 2059]SKA27689.1 hypothetical protein SAMN02745446_03718 [Desulfococcus multivorans DSM 2059]